MDQTLRISQDDPLLGQTLGGKYRVEEVIGRGGMGVVYAGTHVKLGKRIALKVLRGQFHEDADLIARFVQEARAASGIGSAHIVDVTDFGELDGGSAYFVMEHLVGEPLSAAMKRAGQMPPERVVAIAEQICRALGAAHANGIVHRDLKPDNIFLVRRDERADFVKILDFGIAKVAGAAGPMTRSGVVLGTPYYMSPEQASGGAVDGRTDIYALGVILFQMLTGQVPFDGDSFVAILTKHIMAPVPLLSEKRSDAAERPDLEQIVARSMAKSPGERPQSMAELRGALLAAVPAPLTDSQRPSMGRETAAGVTVTLFPPPAPTTLTPVTTGVGRVQGGRGPMLAALVGLPLALAVAVVFVVRGGSHDATRPLPPTPSGTVIGVGSVGPNAPPPGPATIPAPPPGPATTPPGPATIPAPPPGPATTPPGPATAPAPARVHVVSDPLGATVWEGDRSLGATPIDVDRADTARTLVLRAEGRAPTPLTVGPDSPSEIAVTLRPAARAGGRRVGSGSRGEGSTGRQGTGRGHGELRDPFGP
jgi:serine/threonine-protein kinase